MLRITRSLITLVVAGAITPLVANAASFGGVLHLHSTVKNAKTEKVSFVLVNKSDTSRTITVDGQTYTLTPHQQLSITAQAGSQVMDASSGAGATAKVLFTVDRMHKGATISLN